MLRKMLICLLALLLCMPALADEVVELPDLVVTYTPPEGFYLLSRESSASAFTAIGLRQRDIVPWMERNECYAVMYDLDTGSELLLYLAPAEEASLDELSGEELEQLFAYWKEDYELDGCEDVSVTAYESENGRYAQVMYKTYEADGLTCYVASMFAIRSGCHVQMSLFCYGEPPADDLISRLQAMADSICLELPASLTELSAHGVTIRLSIPAGLVLQSDAVPVIDSAPEKPVGEVIGMAVSADGSWYVQWQLVEGVTGDLERVRETGLRSLYEDRARRKKAEGFIVTEKEAVTDLRQRYICLAYEMPQESGESWFAEEYYTKQGGWGVVVTAYSISRPLTEEDSAMLRELIASQLITMKAE